MLSQLICKNVIVCLWSAPNCSCSPLWNYLKKHLQAENQFSSTLSICCSQSPVQQLLYTSKLYKHVSLQLFNIHNWGEGISVCVFFYYIYENVTHFSAGRCFSLLYTRHWTSKHLRKMKLVLGELSGCSCAKLNQIFLEAVCVFDVCVSDVC